MPDCLVFSVILLKYLEDLIVQKVVFDRAADSLNAAGVNGEYIVSKTRKKIRKKTSGSGGIRTHAIEMTGA